MIMDCIFCKIISKDIPAKILHETTNSICFLDAFPLTKGHVLVIQTTHCEKIQNRHAKENEDVMYRVFLNKCDSVKEYYRLLNTHEAYYKFRKYRNYALMNNKPINPKVAIQTMDRYSETPDYADRVIEIIRDIERL